MFGKKDRPVNTAPVSGRLPIVAGNWKLHKTYGEAVQLAQLVVDRLERSWRDQVEVVMCPSFTALRGVSNVIALDNPFGGSFAKVGAQDCYWEDQGAFTGAISPVQLKDLDCSWCIVGHSERRGLFGETNEDVAKKCRALLAHGISPIVCVGEPIEVYEENGTVGFVVNQLLASLEGIEAPNVPFAVAYEPIWAIGTGNTATPEHAQLVAASLRDAIARIWGEEHARSIRVLYGGSVRPANIVEFTGCDDVDGVLVGGASLDADSFIEMIRKVIHA